MSTILKALKQAEKDSPDQGDEIRSSLNIRTALNLRIQQQKNGVFFSLGRIAIVVIMGIVMAISFYSLFFIKKDNHPQPPYIVKPIQVLGSQPDRVDNEEQIAEISENNSLARIIVSEKTVLKSEQVNQAPQEEVFPRKIKKDIKTPSPVPVPNLKQREKETLITDKKERLDKNIPIREIPFLKNDRLRVQAISWAEEPVNRIVVIDNRVLKEGDSVQGYRLVTIEKDSVILQDSGSEYRLGFKYR